MDDSRLILVNGAAGTGKTVLLSSCFYELNQELPDIEEHLGRSKLETYMLVNHNEQVVVYEQIAKKLGLTTNQQPKVMKPTSFINMCEKRYKTKQRQFGSEVARDKVDVVLIDEAHLLLTQGRQSYKGSNHLKDILQWADVVVAVFDPSQVLITSQVWESSEREWLDNRANAHLSLKMQMRMLGSKDTLQWINAFVHDGIIGEVPHDKDYSIRIFDDVNDMYSSIAQKASTVENGLSRMIATYDWKFSNKRPSKDFMWTVSIGEFSLPWNNQIKSSNSRRVGDELSWAEREETINEIGSTFTIQGFDLNYAGVIIGPSVKFRDGRVIFDPEASENIKVKNKRTVKDGSKVSFAEELLRNQLNVLLTRGVNGLYIYAVDEELREALLAADKR